MEEGEGGRREKFLPYYIIHEIIRLGLVGP
jgi:hypothetical protein